MKTAREILESRFSNVEHKKIVIFHSPTDCSKIWYEKVNPTHRAIIWGERKRSENKGLNQIKLGEMFFGATMVASATMIFNLYSTLLGFAFPDLMVWQATFCLIVYGLAGLIIVFPKGVGRFVLCGVRSLTHWSQSEPSSGPSS